MNCIKKELYAYFRQPLFFVLSALFCLAACIRFFVFYFFRAGGSADLHAFFTAVPAVCIIYIPALTALNRSDRRFDGLLPVSAIKMSVCRWIAAYIMFLFACLPLLAVPAVVNFWGDVDAGQTAAGFLGTALYGAAATALCVCSNTAFPDNRGILPGGILALGVVMHLLPWQLCRFLSIAYHFDAAGKGIIDTRDIVYYIAMTAFLLILSGYAAERRKGRHKIRRKELLALAACILCMADGTRFYIRTDLTKSSMFSVSTYSKVLLQSVDNPLHITYFRSRALESAYPASRDIADYLYSYASVSDLITCEAVYAADDDARLLSSYGIEPQFLPGIPQTGGKETPVYSAVVLEYLGSRTVIPFVPSAAALEYALAVKIQYLAFGIQRHVYVLCGNGLSLDDDYGYVVPWLEQLGYVCEQVSTDDIDGSLRDVSIPLIVFGSIKLTDYDVASVERFLRRGGGVLFAISPFHINLHKNWKLTATAADDALLPFLRANGIELGPQIIADDDCVRLRGEGNAVLPYPLWIKLAPQAVIPAGMTWYWPAPVGIYTPYATPLLKSSASARLYAPSAEHADAIDPAVVSAALSAPAGGTDAETAKGRYTVAAVYDGAIKPYYSAEESMPEYTARMIILPDQYVVHTKLLAFSEVPGDFRNMSFLSSALMTLQKEEALCKVYQKSLYSTALYKVTGTGAYLSGMLRILALHAGIIAYMLCAAVIFACAGRKFRSSHA